MSVESLGARGQTAVGGADSERGLLEIRGLAIEVAATRTTLVRGVGLTVTPGGGMGWSGGTRAGKSLTAWSAPGLLPDGLRRAAGSITLGGTDLTACSEDELQAVRGRDVAMIVQNPLYCPGAHHDGRRPAGAGAPGAHGILAQARSRAAAVETLGRRCGLPDPARRCRDYPHQLSGGQAQRVVIAMALLNRPRLVIADEATTGLDVTVQAEVLDLLMEQVAEVGAALLLITHDLGIVANYADTVTAMFAGEVVARPGSTRALFEAPGHPYLRGLMAAADLDSRSQMGSRRAVGARLSPDLAVRSPGCQFAFRCPWQHAACRSPVPLATIGPGHDVRCGRTG